MKRIILLIHLACLCVFYISPTAADNRHPSTEEIRKMQPIERLQACCSILQDSSLSVEMKNQFIQIFAQDARNLSPLYGKSKMPINSTQWIGHLSQGLKTFPENQNIVFAIEPLLINDQQYDRALGVIEPYHQKHPCHETTAWMNYCSSVQDEPSNIETLPKFDIHFCVLTNNPNAHKRCTIQQLKREILILNRTFRTLKKRPVIQFQFKSASFFGDIELYDSPLEQMTNNQQSFDSNLFNQYFNECKLSKIRDPKAINFYIYDSYHEKTGYSDITSHGRRNSNRPYILIDWQRLNNNVQNPTAHEMGHAFGLGHVAVPGAAINTPTNIMSSTQYGFGSGGNRKLGFTEAQMAIILYHAKRTARRLSVSDF